MMAAVQLYNNPQITFKTETFITLSIIAWTYLLHAYYANKKIDYRYFHMNGKKKIYDRLNMVHINTGSWRGAWMMNILLLIQ